MVQGTGRKMQGRRFLDADNVGFIGLAGGGVKIDNIFSKFNVTYRIVAQLYG
jgi:hypothetical protein